MTWSVSSIFTYAANQRQQQRCSCIAVKHNCAADITELNAVNTYNGETKEVKIKKKEKKKKVLQFFIVEWLSQYVWSEEFFFFFCIPYEEKGANCVWVN